MLKIDTEIYANIKGLSLICSYKISLSMWVNIISNNYITERQINKGVLVFDQVSIGNLGDAF